LSRRDAPRPACSTPVARAADDEPEEQALNLSTRATPRSDSEDTECPVVEKMDEDQDQEHDDDDDDDELGGTSSPGVDSVKSETWSVDTDAGAGSHHQLNDLLLANGSLLTQLNHVSTSPLHSLSLFG